MSTLAPKYSKIITAHQEKTWRTLEIELHRFLMMTIVRLNWISGVSIPQKESKISLEESQDKRIILLSNYK